MRCALMAAWIVGVASQTVLWQMAEGAEPGKRPNILFCFADDWGKYAGAYQAIDGPNSLNAIVKTPNVDRVAREGALFRNAFVNAPSCTPCRSALLSGQYFYRTGRAAILSGAIWDGTAPAFPLLLRDAGYHIGKSYKVWSPGAPADAPYGERQYAYERGGGRMNQFSQNVTKMVAEGKSFAQARDEIYAEVKANFAEFLSKREPGKPFCFWFGPTNVHRSWVKGSGKALWGIEPDSLQGKVPPFLPDVPEIREDLADYLGEAQAYDGAIGVLLAHLESLGELDNTLVVISGDHGAPGFTHGKCNLYDFGVHVSLAARGPGIPGGRVIDDFVNLMDLAPTFLEVGGVAIPAAMTGRSLLPILKSDMRGQIDPARDFVIVGRERHVDTARAGNVPYPQRALRTKDFLYIINFKPDRWPMGDPFLLDTPSEPAIEAIGDNTRLTYEDMDAGPTKAWLIGHRKDPQWKKYMDFAFAKRPGEELYDMAKDPDQVNNVAADPQYAAAKAALNKRLMDELSRTGDPRVTQDGAFFETPPMTDAAPRPMPRKAGAGNPRRQPAASE